MNRRDQIILMVIAAVAVVGAYYLLLLSPQVKKASDLDTQLSSLQARRAQAQSSLSTALAAKAVYPRNKRALTVLTTAIPPVDSTSRLLKQIDAAAKAAHVDFAAITLSSSSSTPPPTAPAAPGAPGGTTGPAGAGAAGARSAASTVPPIPPGYANATPAPTVSYTTTFTGNYLQLARFVGAMESFVATGRSRIRVRGRLIDVSSISVAGDQSGGNSVSVTMTAYLLPPSEQTPISVPRGRVG